MPTFSGTVRRSGRKAGKKIPDTQFKHDLFTDPPKVSTKKKKTVVDNAKGKGGGKNVNVTAKIKKRMVVMMILMGTMYWKRMIVSQFYRTLPKIIVKSTYMIGGLGQEMKPLMLGRSLMWQRER